MVEGIRTEEPLGRDCWWGGLGCAARTRQAGEGCQGEPEKISHGNETLLLSDKPQNWNCGGDPGFPVVEGL